MQLRSVFVGALRMEVDSIKAHQKRIELSHACRFSWFDIAFLLQDTNEFMRDYSGLTNNRNVPCSNDNRLRLHS